MPAKSLDTIKETLLYDKEKVSLPGNRDRRINNSSTLADRIDANLEGRVTEFHNLLYQKLYYRIPLKFFTDLDLVHFPHNTGITFLFTLKVI